MKSLLRTLLIIPIASTLIYAQEVNSALERMLKPKVSYESSYMADVTIKGSSGGYEVAKNKLKINNAFLALEYVNQSFIWNDIADLPFGDGVSKPIELLHTIKADIKLPYKVNEELFIINSVSVTSSFESNPEDSYSFGAFSFASYKLDNDHTIQFGAFVNYHPINTTALPMLSYSYRASHQDGFKSVIGFPRTFVGYHLNKHTLVRLGMIYSQSVVKLGDNSVIEKKGYIETKDYMTNVGISSNLTKDLKVELDALYEVQGDINTYDSNGDVQNKYSVDPSFGVNFKVVYTF
ncbi:hypothetical protein [Sulfurimonas sp.]|uniref:hypothetical protein n=1 Tax=Sulfurimonas sp. TaxID=2022749 RepID=UPI0025D5B849|nr:hypothetical protein [Sulfurimonas sp.]